MGDRAMKARLARRMFGAAVTPPRIGRYRIERRIGAGGMGVVYEGFDEQLERRVAIKLLHPELGERHAVRMRREGLALGKMSHPNVVHAYEIGVHDGSVFLVMEFIAGEPLSKWQRAHGHLHTAILEKYIEAGRGLAAAHAAGIVHRDFKPSNVVVCEDGPARVLDFGLARGLGAIVDADEPAGALSNPASSLDVRVTVTGTTMGTPAYMSPEQMLGQPTNAASDQFSFCVALYEGLYGERPFLGENATELYESLLSERVRPAPSASRVPTRIRAIVLRGLRARPEDRFPSMQDLLRALEGSTRRGTWRPVVALGSVAVLGTAWFIGTREPACAEGADAAAQVWSQHRPELTAAFADLPHGDTVVAGIDDRITRYAEGWANRYRETCEIQDATARRRALACLDAHRAALQSLTEVLGSGEGGVIDDAFQLVDELPLPTECAETALSPGEGSQRGQLASAKLDAVAGRTEQARATASAILDEARRTQSTALIAEALFTLALIEIEASDHGAATALLGEAVAAGIAADTPLLVSDAWLELARLESGHASTLGASAEHLRNARAMLQRYTGGSDRLPGDRAGRFATIEGEQALEAGDLDAAETKLRAAVEALEAAHDERHKLVTRARLQLAHVLGAKGESQEAIELYATARTAMTDLAGPYYPQLWAFDYGIALVHLDLEEYENARSRLESALRLLGEAGKRWARQRGQILVALSQTYMFLDREDDGLDAARRARAELESAPPDDQTRRGADGMIATLLQGTGDLDGAAEAFRSLAAGQEAANDRRAAAEVRAHLVTMELRRGRPDDAAAVLERHRDAIAERFGVGRVRVLDDLVAAMQALAAGDEASGHAGLERIRDAIAPDEVDGVQWCDVRAWATLALARSLAADDPVRARTLAEEAKAHLTETPHDLGLLAEVDAFLGA